MLKSYEIQLLARIDIQFLFGTTQAACGLEVRLRCSDERALLSPVVLGRARRSGIADLLQPQHSRPDRIHSGDYVIRPKQFHRAFRGRHLVIEILPRFPLSINLGPLSPGRPLVSRRQERFVCVEPLLAKPTRVFLLALATSSKTREDVRQRRGDSDGHDRQHCRGVHIQRISAASA
ncbi:hypothetical protein GCM10009769_27570 [Curtobacterium luteum]|uniref:Uncharacterized protein n=1 Tax=Curtobacterium luteum TaxID=33881 RepID=A0A8H9GBN4_9MICO|nr:hypothetical protein GCM10009769_27570 [Curtobacterium luteum]